MTDSQPNGDAMKTCESCRWWKDARLTAQMHDIEVGAWGYVVADAKVLGYCEPLIGPAREGWKGLVASDYTCSEHKKRGDD